MKALLLATVIAVAGCHQGNGLGAGDLSEPVDLSEPDLLPPVDMVPPPTCGKIVFCAFMCGTTNLTCVLGCGQSAPAAEVGAALSLVGCAAQNCLASDMGAGGMLQILQCLQDKCPMQLNACSGIGIGARQSF
ncbi:MAG: hypothetical protein JWN44_4274 [Myxococcales bacterium]|nr:hypothetical protein [Myxococcales bacterium]